MSNPMQAYRSPLIAKKEELAARAKAEKEAALAKAAADPSKALTATEVQHRIGILFDDSGSMDGRKLTDAHAGVEEFLRCCTPKETSVAIYPMNQAPYSLSLNLPALSVLAKRIMATDYTPLVSTLDTMLRDEPLTRAIVFSDGLPDKYAQDQYKKVIERGIVIDTVYITNSSEMDRGAAFLRTLAEDTGGMFLRFEAGSNNFRKNFKYLAPALRHFLEDGNFRAGIQK